MSDQALGEAPAPFGAPETTATPGQAGGYFEHGRPRLGGLANGVRLVPGPRRGVGPAYEGDRRS